MKNIMKKKFLVLLGCTLLVALVAIPNALGNPNPRVTVLFGGSFLNGERAFDISGDSFTSKFLKGGKTRLRGSLNLTEHWTLEGDYSFGHNDQRITDLSGVTPVETDFGVSVGQFHFNMIRFLTSSESRIRPLFSVSLGATRFNPTDEAKEAALNDDFLRDPTQLESSVQLSVAVGGGFEARLSRWLGLRFDVKDYISPIPRFGLSETSSGQGGVFFPISGVVHNIETEGGIIFYFLP